MLNEHHQSATCMCSTVVVALATLARITKRARLLVLGYPIGHRPDPLRCAEELHACALSDEAFADLEHHFEPPEIVELLLLLSFYQAVARLIDGFGLEVEPEYRRADRSHG